MPVDEIVTTVVAPYFMSRLPPDSTIEKFVVARLPALPVVFWLSVGKVQFVSVPDVGVPNTGVTSVGDVIVGVVKAALVDRTLLPDPVEVDTPVPPLATGKIPVKLEACKA